MWAEANLEILISLLSVSMDLSPGPWLGRAAGEPLATPVSEVIGTVFWVGPFLFGSCFLAPRKKKEREKLFQVIRVHDGEEDRPTQTPGWTCE